MYLLFVHLAKERERERERERKGGKESPKNFITVI